MICQATQTLYLNATDAPQQGRLALYGQARVRAQRGQLWASLTGRSRGLLSLEEASQGCTVVARSSGGTRTVAIAQIRGSENRAGDFDCDFNPLQDHTRDRWLGIAMALQRGRRLPPVALIQVGDRYFVRDGHHRISVARALGQEAIEATVEIWQLDKPSAREQRPLAVGCSGARRREPRRLARGSSEASILGWLSGMLRPANGAGASPVCR